MEIYWFSGSSPSWRVLLTLAIKGVRYDSRLLNVSQGDLKTPYFLAINPRGKVPALRDGDFVLTESLAIMVYLDRAYPDPPLFGGTAAEAGRVWEIISASESYFQASALGVILPIFIGSAHEKATEVGRGGRRPQRAGGPGGGAGDRRQLARGRPRQRCRHRRLSVPRGAAARRRQGRRRAARSGSAAVCRALPGAGGMARAGGNAARLRRGLSAALARGGVIGDRCAPGSSRRRPAVSTWRSSSHRRFAGRWLAGPADRKTPCGQRSLKRKKAFDCLCRGAYISPSRRRLA